MRPFGRKPRTELPIRTRTLGVKFCHFGVQHMRRVLKGNLLWPPCFCVTCGFSSSRLCQDLQKCGDACRLLIVADQRSDFSSDPPKIDDCRTGPTRIDLRFDKATKVLGYNFWDNDESTSQNTKLFWRLEHTPSGCWAKYSQTPYLLFIPSPQY